jgi:hypothetical protein
MIKYLQWFGPSASFSTRARSLDLSLCILILAGCATGARDDFKLRRDIDGLHLVKMPIEGAKARLAAHGFVCEKDTVPYEGSFLRSVYCVRTIKGLGCRDDEHVTLEYVAESSLVDRFATGRKNGCN